MRLRLVTWTVAIGSVCLLATASPGQPVGLDDVPEFQGMRARWAGAMDDFNVPGMAIAIVRDGRILAIETFGVRAPGPQGQADGPAPDPETMYYIASITKTYLATAVGVLVDEGKLSLDDPVKKYLPRFALADGSGSGADSITIRDLLSHKPGIGGSPIVDLDAYTGEITEDRYYRWLATIKPTGKTDYTNIHFTLLGRVVESVGGKPWRDYLQERLFTPARLTRTTGYASRMYADANSATPMERVDGKWEACKLRKTDRTMHAAGGLGSSVADAARYLLLHLNDGEIDGTRVISANMAREMRKLQSRLPDKQGSIRVMEGFGLGWQVGTFHGTPLCSHGGGYAGTATYYAILPEKNCGFVVLMNAGGAAAGLQDVIAVDILDRLIEGDERVDVYDSYRKRVAEQKKRYEVRTAQSKSERSKPFELSRPMNGYVGRYQNTDLGVVTVAADGDRLKVSAGECELDVMAAGADSFKVLGPAFEESVFKFSPSADGSVTEVSVELKGSGTLVFKK